MDYFEKVNAEDEDQWKPIEPSFALTLDEWIPFVEFVGVNANFILYIPDPCLKSLLKKFKESKLCVTEEDSEEEDTEWSEPKEVQED